MILKVNQLLGSNVPQCCAIGQLIYNNLNQPLENDQFEQIVSLVLELKEEHETLRRAYEDMLVDE